MDVGFKTEAKSNDLAWAWNSEQMKGEKKWSKYVTKIVL